MEWQDHYHRETFFGDRVRCLNWGHGRIMRGDTHRWPLVSRGENLAHNLLKALAAFYAVNALSKTILLSIDKTTAVAYANNLGGGETVSPRLNSIVRELWLWCMILHCMNAENYATYVDCYLWVSNYA